VNLNLSKRLFSPGFRDITSASSAHSPLGLQQAKGSQSSTTPSSEPTDEQKGPERKYVIAFLVFLLACLYDKQVMHGGIFPH
jgi:hypothetical protein